MSDERESGPGGAPRDDSDPAVPGVDTGHHDRARRFTAGVGDRGGKLSTNGRIVFGLVVVGLGVLFTLDNLGVLSASDTLRWWPTLLIAFGVARLTGFGGGRNLTVGLIATIAGTVLLLHQLGAIGWSVWDLWPAVFILFGLGMIRGALQRRREAEGRAGTPPGDDPSSTFSTFSFWAGIERKVTSAAFRGGDATAIMGGAEIDLRPAHMQGERAVIDVTVLWGGVELYVPADWRVTVEAVPLLAGVEDSTQAPVGEARGHLVVRGVVLMGGLEVKN